MAKPCKRGRGNETSNDFLKIGMIAVISAFVAGIAFAVSSAITDFAKWAYGVAKAEARVVVGLPIALSMVFLAFPDLPKETGAVLGEIVPDTISFSGFGVSTTASQPIGLTTLSQLRGCTNSMTYASTLEGSPGQRCASLCQEREYVSYGIVDNGNSYDCYCCQASGTPVPGK